MVEVGGVVHAEKYGRRNLKQRPEQKEDAEEDPCRTPF